MTTKTSRKIEKNFQFTKPIDEVIKLVNEKFPINLLPIEELINEVHDRYPYVEKHQVVYEIQCILEGLREGLIRKKVFLFPYLTKGTHLGFYKNHGKVICRIFAKAKKSFRDIS